MALGPSNRAIPETPGRQRRPLPATYGARARKIGAVVTVYFLLAAALATGAAFFPSPIWAYGALLVFCGFCFGLLQHSPVTFLFFAPLLALRITEFISGAAIESGAYMIEVAAYGKATGAFTHLLLIYILFFGTGALVTERIWPRLRRLIADAPSLWARHARAIWYALLIILMIGTIYLIRLGMNNGFPMFSGTDRFVYLEKLNSPYYKALLLNRIVIIPFVGILFTIPAYRIRAIVLIAWILAASITFSEKFTSLLMILSMFAVPAGLVHVAQERPIPLKFVGTIAIAVVTITVPAVLLVYGAASNFDAAAKRYGDRVALQGQLWYCTDARFLSVSNYDPNAIGSDVASWLQLQPSKQVSTTTGTRFGLYYVMQKFTPTRTLGWTMEGGGGFVFSLYPYLLMTTGLVGMLLISSLIAIYHVWLMRMLVEALARSSWLAALAFGRVMSSFYACYSAGYLWNIFGIKTLITLGVGIFLLWESQRRGSWSNQAFTRLAKRARGTSSRQTG